MSSDSNQRPTIAESYAWCEAQGLMPAIKAAAKQKPPMSERQKELIARVMKRPRP